MPEGSSSAAPVIKPGPRLAKNRTIRLRLSLLGFRARSVMMMCVSKVAFFFVWSTRHPRLAGSGTRSSRPSGCSRSNRCEPRGPPRQKQHRGLTIRGMIGPAKIYFIIFGLLTIIGGVIGYVQAGSTASIVAGSVSGILLCVAAYLLPQNPAAGLILAGVISILLAGRFVPAFLKTGQAMPAGLMSVLSLLGVIVAIVAWIKK